MESYKCGIQGRWSGRWIGRKITGERAEAAARALGRLAATYAPWDVAAERVWEPRHDLTPYDAA